MSPAASFYIFADKTTKLYQMSDADKAIKLYGMSDADYRNLLIKTIVIYYVHKLHFSSC